MLITNISPLGDLDVPLLGRVVAAGEQVEVTDDEAWALLAQHNTFAPADKPATGIAELHAEARAEGLPYHDPDLVEDPAPAISTPETVPPAVPAAVAPVVPPAVVVPPVTAPAVPAPSSAPDTAPAAGATDEIEVTA